MEIGELYRGTSTPTLHKAMRHTFARDGDVACLPYSPKALADIIERLIKEGKMKQGGIGLYPGFVHNDIGKFKSRW